jgi:hypothetical protein
MLDGGDTDLALTLRMSWMDSASDFAGLYGSVSSSALIPKAGAGFGCAAGSGSWLGVGAGGASLMNSGSGSFSPYSSDLRSEYPEPQPTALDSSFGATLAALRKSGNGVVACVSEGRLVVLPRGLNKLREVSLFLAVPLT